MKILQLILSSGQPSPTHFIITLSQRLVKHSFYHHGHLRQNILPISRGAPFDSQRPLISSPLGPLPLLPRYRPSNRHNTTFSRPYPRLCAPKHISTVLQFIPPPSSPPTPRRPKGPSPQNPTDFQRVTRREELYLRRRRHCGSFLDRRRHSSHDDTLYERRVLREDIHSVSVKKKRN